MKSPRKYNQTIINRKFLSGRLFIGIFVFSLALIFTGSFAFRTQAATGINQQISFQGKVVNSNGTNVANGSYTFVFRLYDVDTGGTHIWTESKSLTVTDGIFQTNLGDTTALPGSVDFNTDNIYLGINFNSDGEMSPRVRFTAAPYAFNAKKVGGLTVTDTTGTLTIPNGKTISFADAFTTSGAFPLTLTSTASTTATLPSGTITLADLTTAQSLTNKTIGSTGLTFSGAATDITTATGEDLTVVANGAGIINLNDSVTSGALTISGAATDITTASGESLVIVANGAGVVDIQDATTVDSLTVDTGGVSIASGQSYTGAGAVSLSSAAATALTVDSGTTGTVNLGTSNNAKTINLGTGTAGNTINIATDNATKDTLNIGSALDDVAITSDSWSITNAGALTVVSCSGCGGGATLDSAYTAGNTITTDSGSNVAITLQDVASPTSFTVENQDTAGTSAERIFNSIASGTLTNGLLIEQTGAGTMTNGIQIAETAGTITDGILITGTLGNILNTGSIDITGAGAITGATGVSTTTVTASSTIDAQGDISDSTGNLTLNDAVDISGALVVSGTTLTATSATTITLGSTGADAITIGNAGADTITIGNAASTGVSIVDNNWSVTTAGVGTFVSGTVIGSQTFTTNNIADSGALTISSGGANTALTLNSATTGTINIGTDGSAETINIGNTGAAAKTVLIGDSAQTNTVTIGSATATTVSITDNNWSISAAGAAAFASLSSSGAIAANGGITFDASTDTVGAFTAAGTIDMNTNILTNIGNTGTDFIASTGALTLAGVLTANGGISLAGSQSFTASALSYVDLGSITHSTTANQGLRLPNAASASPSNPTSGEGYLAWDAGGNQVIYYNGSAWATFSAGGGYATIKDETTGLTQRTTLAFLGAGVSCADNVTQTECTISGGSGSDLQGTYGADADGSNATISLTAADDGLIFTNPTSGGNDLSTFLLQLDQANTTANVKALDIVQSSNAANAVNITANAIDGETGLAVTTNGLTSGSGISVASSSTTMTGNLAQVTMSGSGSGNTGDLLELSNTGTANTNTTLHIDHRATGTGNLALRVDDESGDTTPFIIDGDGRVGIGTSSITTTSAGTPALQVGSATNRSSVSAYGDLTAEGYDIQRSLTGIIDIFVYDTSRDADGGEWRNNTLSQQLSWYTETKDNTGPACVIGTDDRCGKSEFPRKAILVTTATALHIFDGADNTLWMTFTQAGTNSMGADTNNNPSGVGAQNGVIVVGTNGSSATGMYAFDFKQDTMFRYNATNRVQGDKNIGNRNSTVTYSTDANTSMAIADAAVNDVSIAMQTGSTEGMANTLTLPLDSATSPVRGVTIIAAATNTAISVVNMGSRKTLNYSDVTNDDYYQVVMTTRGRLYATNATQQQLEEWRNIDRDIANETNGTPDRTYDELTPNGATGKTPITTGTAPTFSVANPSSLAVIERSSSARESAATTALESGDIVFVGSNQGLAEVHTSGGALLGASWSKITTTTVATPYMIGAPRGVFLFDEAVGSTAATSAVGTSGSTKQVLDTAGATAPTFGVNGVRGKAINFNNNSYLCSDANADGTCDADTDFNAGTIGFTVSLWFKHGTTAAADALFERCYTPATPTAAVGCIYAGMTASGTIRFAIDSLTTWTYDTTYDDTIVSTAAYNDNQWHHAVFTNTDTDICMYIDGKQAVACDTAIAATATMDASQVLTVGGVCSGANCTTGTNFWDGSMDDFVWSSNGATTDNGLPAQGALKLYLDGRAHLIRPSTTVTDATAFSSTTIGDSGEAYVPGTFAGLVVELTGGTGSGQTRMIVSNDATTFTVSPAWGTTPDATTDYQVSPGRLYGATNTVTAIAPDLPTNLNRLRRVYVGTSDGSDGGGITVFTNAGTGSLKTQVIHSTAGYQNDDLGSSWTGTDADDISAMASYSDTLAIGSGAFMRAQRATVSLKQLQIDTSSALEDIRQELVSKQLFGSTQDVLGLGQGADLAERYYSNESLEAGDIVSIDATLDAGVKRSIDRYQRNVLGVVATKPAIILGGEAENAYPVALAGRVPVKVTNENGPIYNGDRITASSRPGYGMFASQAGRVIGTALSDAGDWVICDPTDTSETPKLCTTVMVFVNLSDYYGQPVELAMAERDKATGAAALEPATGDEEVGLVGTGASVRLATAVPTREEKLLAFLKEIRDERAKTSAAPSEVFTDRVAASSEVITPRLIVDEIIAKSIKADSIEGLSIWTNQIASLEAKYAGLVPETTPEAGDIEVSKEKTLLNLEQFQVGSISVAFDANVLGKLSVTGALRVIDAAEFGGETTFASLVSFLSDTVFKGKVVFETAPTFGSDTAGFATIEKGRKKVRVNFAEAYEKQPIVTVALTRDLSPLLDNKADADLKADVAAVEKDFAETLFDAGIQYLVTEKDQTGFTILLSKDAPVDLSFSWVAIAVKGANTFESGKGSEEPKADMPVIQPVETPIVPVTLPASLPTETTPVPDEVSAEAVTSAVVPTTT